MRDVMVDIETMGRGYRAAVVAIGAVRFDPVACKVGNDEASKFYTTIDLRDCQHHGQILDADTVLWWLAQSVEARSEILSHGSMGIQIALIRFASFVGTIKGTRVWGNGSNFDNRILREAYELVDMECPWHYRHDRDMRTIVGLAETWNIETEMEFEGTRHHALHDAVYQAQVVCDLYRKIRDDR